MRFTTWVKRRRRKKLYYLYSCAFLECKKLLFWFQFWKAGEQEKEYFWPHTEFIIEESQWKVLWDSVFPKIFMNFTSISLFIAKLILVDFYHFLLHFKSGRIVAMYQYIYICIDSNLKGRTWPTLWSWKTSILMIAQVEGSGLHACAHEPV